MAWHSTGNREELLVGLAGRATVEVACAPREVWRVRFSAQACVWLPAATRHRVVNRGPGPARYLYVTGR